MISEYTKKWNDEKKKQVAERRKNVGARMSCDIQKRLHREQREQEEKESKKVEEDKQQDSNPSELTKSNEPKEHSSKKLDLKRLAIALNDDSD